MLPNNQRNIHFVELYWTIQFLLLITLMYQPLQVFIIWVCSVDAALDPLFWQQIRSTATEREAADVLGRFMDDVNAPGPDSAFPRPSPVLNSGLFLRDPDLDREYQILVCFSAILNWQRCSRGQRWRSFNISRTWICPIMHAEATGIRSQWFLHKYWAPS